MQGFTQNGRRRLRGAQRISQFTLLSFHFSSGGGGSSRGSSIIFYGHLSEK
jgi:hypothetical protein